MKHVFHPFLFLFDEQNVLLVMKKKRFVKTSLFPFK